jgi:hypothetical protein
MRRPPRCILPFLCTLIFLVSIPHTRTSAEDAAQRDIAIHWSPFFYQASQNNYDIPTNFDFDGNWDGNDNWDNAYIYRNSFRTRVYYTYQESSSNIYLTYLVFHPRDYKSIGGHENDLEGARVRVEKDGSQYGVFRDFLTFAHGTFHVTYAPEWINGTHPAAYIEAKGHGIYYWNNGVFPDSCGGMGIWYAGRGAETPDHCDDRDVSMDLIPFEDTLWPIRVYDPNWGTYSETASYVTGAYYGRRFRGHDGCKAKPPWGWANDGGAWFLKPGSEESWIVNAYLDTSSQSMYACPS